MARSRHRVRRYVGEKIWNAEQAAKRSTRAATFHAEEIEAAFFDRDQRRLEFAEARMLEAAAAGLDAVCLVAAEECRAIAAEIREAA